jgi:hypothetical protein
MTNYSKSLVGSNGMVHWPSISPLDPPSSQTGIVVSLTEPSLVHPLIETISPPPQSSSTPAPTKSKTLFPLSPSAPLPYPISQISLVPRSFPPSPRALSPHFPPHPSKGYALRSKVKHKEVSPSKGVLSLDVPRVSTIGRKYHISKAKELDVAKIKKCMQPTITRTLRSGKAEPPLKK